MEPDCAQSFREDRFEFQGKRAAYALLNLALADGYIASWNTKYYYKFWRPETAIHEADHDGNPNTSGDPAWTPLTSTPPIPDYNSAHAVEGAAAAQVFQRFFGTAV